MQWIVEDVVRPCVWLTRLAFRFSAVFVAARYGPAVGHLPAVAAAAILDIVCALVWAHLHNETVTKRRALIPIAFFAISAIVSKAAGHDPAFNIIPAFVAILHAQRFAPILADLAATAGAAAITYHVANGADWRLVIYAVPFDLVGAASMLAWIDSAYLVAALSVVALLVGVAIFLFTPVYSVAIVGAFIVYALAAITLTGIRRMRPRIVA